MARCKLVTSLLYLGLFSVVLILFVVHREICMVATNVKWLQKPSPHLRIRHEDPTRPGKTHTKSTFKPVSAKVKVNSRNVILREACANRGKLELDALPILYRYQLLHHILVDDKHKILYCYIPKVACSNWKRVLMVLDGRASDTDSISHDQAHNSGVSRLANYTDEQIQFRLKYYYKFMFVRDPLDRLVSAYNDKIQGGDPYWQLFQFQDILPLFRTKQQLVHGNNTATFVEFFLYLQTMNPITMDEHFMPQHLLCQPCVVKYNFIGTFENLREETKEVLIRMNLDSKVKFPHKQRTYIEHAQNSPSATELLTQIPQSLIQALVNRYSDDYELFSYKKP
ncbi:carbohydrate sulfotransferase 14 [Nematostella vectensis]|uniref:carbohydrate sulfotransferase 14 n=1 Tax=Nematostella vectensis TaxID=45351 RepID=UPI00207763FC|nr:carbohydrate sulfotransferase 14 [Nematostella vectensis]